MKIALIYDRKNPRLSGHWYWNHHHRFFMKGLPENPRVDVTKFSFNKDEEYDCLTLKNFDVLLFCCAPYWAKFLNADKVKGLKVGQSGDSHEINENYITAYRRLGIENVFNDQTKIYAKKFLPKDIKYHQIVFGINEEVYTANKPWISRRKDKILLSGTLWSSYLYELRKACSKLEYVIYKRFPGKYSDVLNQYRAAIAASTFYSVAKYWEMPACGCLTFMEATEENGCKDLGFIDGHNAIFIDKNNFISRMREYIDNPDDPNWKAIANNGRDFVLTNYENEIQLNKFIDILEGLL